MKKKPKEAQRLEQTIDELKDQIAQMKSLITELCTTILKDSLHKERVINNLEKIGNKSNRSENNSQMNIRKNHEENAPLHQKEVIEIDNSGKRKERNKNLYCVSNVELSGQASYYIEFRISCKNRKLVKSRSHE